MNMIQKIFSPLLLGLLLALSLTSCAPGEPALQPPPPQQPTDPLAPTPDSRPETMAPAQAERHPQPGLSETRMLTLEYPPRIRAGDSDQIRLTFETDSNGTLTATAATAGNQPQREIIQIPNIYETHYVIAEARLDMAGIQISPLGLVSQSLQPGQTLTFTWSIRAEEPATHRGTVWFYLRYVPIDGGPEQRQALSAQKIEIEAVNFLGLKAQTARWLGAAGIAVSFILGQPIFGNAFKWAWQRVRISKRKQGSKKKSG
jgi:hypothetical protein